MFSVDVILNRISITQLRYKYDSYIDIESEVELQELWEKLEIAANELGWKCKQSGVA